MKKTNGYALVDRKTGKIVWTGLEKVTRLKDSENDGYLDRSGWFFDKKSVRLIRVRLIEVKGKKK